MVEVECRYKVQSPETVVHTLKEQGIEAVKTKHIIDKWFVPEHVRSRAEHNKWFDEDHGEAFRIRLTERADANFDVVVDSKQHTEAGNHNTFQERIIDGISSEEDAREYLARKGYYNWLTIDKQRVVFDAKDPNVEVVLDEISGLAEKIGIGAALELEYQGEAGRDQALAHLKDMAAKLGFSDEDLFEKSLTVTAMDVLARFKS